MIRINEHYLKLQASYLFTDIAKRVSAFQKAHPDKEVIKLGMGDVTLPLPPASIQAFHTAVDEMAQVATFRGYGPDQGYDFLREKIAREDFQTRGADIAPDEIFVSDGAKCDSSNILDLFAIDITVAIPDPTFPVYLDTNVMTGRTGGFARGRYEGVVYLECTRANNFILPLPKEKVDLIYLCFPDNPTGGVITKPQLKRWVDYARANRAIILYDAAYETFIRDDSLPHSIFEIEGAREVAIEFRSFSKQAGFTGTRCAYTVVPKDCTAYTAAGEPKPVHPLWLRRHTTKFNGVSYPVQRAAEAVYSPEGRIQCRELIDYYLRNAALIRSEMTALGYDCIGGDHSPYIWVDGREDSWAFFDRLLEKANVVCTPGVGFGRCGAGYIRISAFNDYNKVQRAMERVRKALA
jgi:LL-diaminopimelate aminotransferase